jgi:rod shape-determining protein MreD
MTVPRLAATSRAAALVSLLVLVQVAFASQMRVDRVSPDLLLLISVATGVAAGPDRGAIVGFFAGLGYDIFLSSPFGLSALVYCVVAYAAGLFQLPLATHPRWWRAISTTLASTAGVLLWVGMGLVLGQDQLLGLPILRTVAIVTVVNGLLSLPALAAASWAFAPLAPARPV